MSGEPTHMTMAGLMKCYAFAGMLDENFTREECKIIFVLSQPIYLNEMKTTKHTMLSWVDFLEAIARSHSYIALPPNHHIDPEADTRSAPIKIALVLHLLVSGIQAAVSGGGGAVVDKTAQLTKVGATGLARLGLESHLVAEDRPNADHQLYTAKYIHS
jgi:hypothetical protein